MGVPERFWYCRLALNHKVLHYGDLEDNAQGEVTFESLQEKSKSWFLLWVPCATFCALLSRGRESTILFSCGWSPNWDESNFWSLPESFESWHSLVFLKTANRMWCWQCVLENCSKELQNQEQGSAATARQSSGFFLVRVSSLWVLLLHC